VSAARTLSRDYKHVAQQRPGAGQAFNGWTGLAIGLAIGLGVAFAVHLHYRGLQAPALPQPEAAASPASAQAAEETPAPVDPAKNFTFYDVLPNQEVEVPADAARPAPPSDVLPHGDVVLQAGAFKQVAEAEKLQARLAQYGVVAKIQRISLEDETWYRVRIGPIETVEEFDRIRTKLAEADIEASPVVPVPEQPLP